LSPELARGQAVDARSVVFAFGAVLYEMVSGRRAFSGGTAVDLLIAVSRDEPPPASTRSPAVPPELDGLLERCLIYYFDESSRSARVFMRPWRATA
jgi:hypothetical protein